MTKKTGVKLRVCYTLAQRRVTETYTVKIDGKGFPYVVFQNEKIIIAHAEFPTTCHWIYGLWEVEVDLVAGLDELKTILANEDPNYERLNR